MTAITTKTTTKENEMLLLHEELARSHQARLLSESRREARLARLARLVAARRWARRAEAASRRARAASLSVW